MRIGGLVWMAENLRFNADGSRGYDNDESNGERYGRLYTYEAARAACPAGWRLPTREEWVSLARGVNGGEERREGGASLWFPDAGMKLKSAGGDWSSDDCREGEDVCGFCALPSHADCAGEAKWWSSSVGAERDSVHVFAMSGEYDDAYVDETPKSGMYLVRCVKE